MYKIKRYFKGVIKQGKMVRWPTGKQLLGYFGVVIAVVVFSAVACSIDDYIIAKILGVLDRNFAKGEVASEAEAQIAMIKTMLTCLISK